MKISIKHSVLVVLAGMSSQLSSCKSRSSNSSAKTSPESAESLFLPDGHSCSKWFQTKVIATRAKSSVISKTGQANFKSESGSSEFVVSGMNEKSAGKEINAGTRYSLNSCKINDVSSKDGTIRSQLSISVTNEQGSDDDGTLFTVTSADHKSIEDAIRGVLVEFNL